LLHFEDDHLKDARILKPSQDLTTHQVALALANLCHFEHASLPMYA